VEDANGGKEAGSPVFRSPGQQQEGGDGEQQEEDSFASLDRTETKEAISLYSQHNINNSAAMDHMPMLNSSGDLGLTPSDRQVLSMARKYHALREGEWWLRVQRELTELRVKPIEADLALIDSRLEHFFDASQAVQMEQMELFDEDQRTKKELEDQFMGHIITKKNQQIKAEWLKRNGRTKGNTSNPFNKKK